MTASPTDDIDSAERRNQELTKELAQARGELAEAHEQQAATAGVLAAISNSPTDPYRAFAEIAASAARLCGAHNAAIWKLTDGCLGLVANYGSLPATGPVGQARLPLSRRLTIGRAIIDKQTIHVADLQDETDEYPEGSEIARRLGHHSVLIVPLMRAGEAVGAITIRRNEVRPFTDKQIGLLKTFADHAVIAIENARLFEEAQTRGAKLRSALEQQTATSDILRVIGSSPTSIQPVFDSIAANAGKLCNGLFSTLFQFDGELLHWVASNTTASPKLLELMHRLFPRRPTRSNGVGRAILDRMVVHIPDVEADPDYRHQDVTRMIGMRSGIWVPVVREGAPVG